MVKEQVNGEAQVVVIAVKVLQQKKENIKKTKEQKWKYENNIIGRGAYDQEGNSKKIGTWVELDEKFKQWNQVTSNGEYNQQGQKVSTWVEMNIRQNEKRGEKKYNG